MKMLRAAFATVALLPIALAERDGCQCLTSAADYGVSGDFIFNYGGQPHNYGATYGLTSCETHDLGRDPFCSDAAKANLPGGLLPGWCKDPWCYVDPILCDTPLPATQSAYFPNLFYSYSTCGASNTFSDWFGGNAGTVHTLPELAGVASTYATSIVTQLEDSEAELRTASNLACGYDTSC